MMVVVEDIGVGAVEWGTWEQRGKMNRVMNSYNATLWFDLISGLASGRIWVADGIVNE